MPMPRGDEGKPNTLGIPVGNESTRQPDDSVWAVGDADSVHPSGDVIVDPLGHREELVSTPSYLPTVVRTAAWSVAGGLGAGVVTAAFSFVMDSHNLSWTAPLVIGVLTASAIAAAISISRIIWPADN